MAYNLLLQVPEVPVKEEWIWTTDMIVAHDGSEDPIPLNRYPRRSFSGIFEFDDIVDVRYHRALMFKSFGRVFRVGLFQYQVKLKASAASGVSTLMMNTARGDFRVGGTVLITEGSTYELLEVDSIAADSLTFTTTTANAYSARALICPTTEVFTATGSSFSRRNPDESASAGFTFTEYEPIGPFVAPENESSITTFDTLAVLDERATGVSFEEAIDTGIYIGDYIGKKDVFTPWAQSQWVFPLRWQCNRVLDNDSWLWWMAFADYIQGSSGQFLIPSFREDLAITTPAAGGTNLMTLTGHEFQDHYYGVDTFSRIVIESSLGRHFAKVTGVTSVSGDDRITFTPSLPAGAGWSVDQKVGFLLKVRCADDKVTCDHYGLHTDITMSVRTVA